MTRHPSRQRGDEIGGRYTVCRALTGGVGEVYLCLDLKTNQPFALKTFQARFPAGLKSREAFTAEVATWVALEKHVHTVRCFFSDYIDNRPFMCLEWVEGDEHYGAGSRPPPRTSWRSGAARAPRPPRNRDGPHRVFVRPGMSTRRGSARANR